MRKEFRQIFRDKAILAIIFVMPTIQFLILPLAANYEVKNVNVAVVDHDKSGFSRELITKIGSSGYFILVNYNESYDVAMKDVELDKADLILEIPKGFEKNLVKEEHEQVFVAVNAINGSKANLGGSYLQQTLADFNKEVRMKLIDPQKFPPQPMIDIASSNWFNPHMNYRMYFVPGILALQIGRAHV